jgi:hypothetical protein
MFFCPVAKKIGNLYHCLKVNLKAALIIFALLIYSAYCHIKFYCLSTNTAKYIGKT